MWVGLSGQHGAHAQIKCTVSTFFRLGVVHCLKMGSCWKFIYVVPLLLLSLACLIATLVLGKDPAAHLSTHPHGFFAAIIGIGKATEDNNCILTNGSCTRSTDIQPADVGPTVEGLDPGEDPHEFTYWLAGATGCGFILAIITTFSLWALEDALRPIVK